MTRTRFAWQVAFRAFLLGVTSLAYPAYHDSPIQYLLIGWIGYNAVWILYRIWALILTPYRLFSLEPVDIEIVELK